MNSVRAMVVAAVATAFAQAQTLSPFDFLRSAESARAAGLAGAFVAIAGDVSAQLYNPAVLPTTEDRSFSLTFIKHVLDINSGVAAYGSTLGKGRWGASAAFTSFGSFTRTDAFGNPAGSFSASHVALQLSYANQFDTNAYYGITIGYVQTTLDRVAASAIVASAGLLYQMPHIRTTVGASLRYLGIQLTRMNGEDAALPTDFRIGVSHRLRGLPLLVNFNLTRLAEQNQSFGDRLRNFAISGELYVGKSVQLRVGYDNGIRSSQSAATASVLTGFGVGAGIIFPSLTLDYTVTTLSAPALVHRLSCGVLFDRLFDEK
ncbi:MAG: PorV/PorQ family protein [Chlorobi bacterium]|nr:PorV/PorQ family protein [Chlorobiota bacterium]